MTTTQTPTYTIRFTAVGIPGGKPNIDRVWTIPVHMESAPSGYSGLTVEAFYISNAQPGAKITQEQGQYVRTWELLEVTP